MLAVLIIIIFCFVPTFHDSPLLLLLQDYEYASFNPVAYDIANHFCEMAADYHSANPHILDYSKYPGIATLGEAADAWTSILQMSLLNLGSVSVFLMYYSLLHNRYG
jgi:hypothetical protein